MNIKEKYLLEAKLGILHFETIDWMAQIQFYFDEFCALQELLNRRKDQDGIEEQVHKDMVLRVTTMMKRISNVVISDLIEHEKYLSCILMEEEGNNRSVLNRYLRNRFANDAKFKELQYRDKHRLIAQKIIGLQKDVKGLKQDIYRFLSKKHPKQRHGFDRGHC
tara:strand:+ start:2114 stop:2605 length:492 start_codon:yes stop_codon:yes gene_type:complete